MLFRLMVVDGTFSGAILFFAFLCVLPGDGQNERKAAKVAKIGFLVASPLLVIWTYRACGAFVFWFWTGNF